MDPKDANNPKGLARAPQVIDDQAVPGVADSGKGKTYVVRYIYNDGTVEDEYRRYSGKGQENDTVIKKVPKADNEDQVARWKEQQRTAAAAVPTATSQATAGRQSQNREMSVNPATNKPAWKITNFDGTVEYDENVPATATGGVAANAKGRKGTVENGEWVEREIEADGSQGRIVEQRPATKAEKDNAAGKDPAEDARNEARKNKWTETGRQTTKNEQTGQNEATITEQNELGESRTRSASETTIAKPEKPTLVDLPGGGKGQLVPDPDNPGQYKAVPVAGTASPSGRSVRNPIDPTAALGTLYSAYQRTVAQIDADTTLTDDEKYKRITMAANEIKTLASETDTILGVQQNQLNNATTQRGQTLNEGASRRTFAGNLVTNAIQESTAKASYLPPGSADLMKRAFGQRLALTMGMAQAMGGFPGMETAQGGPALQQANQLGLPNAGGQPAAPAAPAAPGGGININLNMPPNVQSLPQPQMPVPEGMRVDDGLLRAPGYRADEDMPAWQIPGM